MLDFDEPGDLGVFIDEHRRAQRETDDRRAASMPGAELGFVFQTLRANDLIWPYVVSNYLKGKSPPAFDLLYWNADATNLPGPMYAWYLRNMYLENNLRVPEQADDVRHAGRPRATSTCRATCSRRSEDHIVPWRAAYRHDAAGGRQDAVRARRQRPHRRRDQSAVEEQAQLLDRRR